MITEIDYSRAEGKLAFGGHDNSLILEKVDAAVSAVVQVYGEDSFIIKIIKVAQKALDDLQPLLILLLELLKACKPILIVDGKFKKPGKWELIKQVQLAWASGEFILKLIKHLMK